MTADNTQKANIKKYAQIIGFLIISFIIFGILKILTTNFRFLDGIVGRLFHTMLFLFVLYAYIRLSAKKQGLTLEECRITKFRCSKYDLLRAISIPLIISIGVLIIAGGIRPTGVDLGDLAHFSLLNFIWSSVGAGVTEELFFRGYLFKIVEAKTNWKVAVILTSILFGIGHIFSGITPTHMFCAFIGSASLGALFAVMTYKQGTIWGSVLIHMCMNSKERLIGFDKSSSLYVFDFTNIPIATQASISWAVVLIISVIVILIDLRTLRKAETHF